MKRDYKQDKHKEKVILIPKKDVTKDNKKPKDQRK